MLAKTNPLQMCVWEIDTNSAYRSSLRRKLVFKMIKNNRFLVLGRAGLDLYADPPGAKVEDALNFSTALGGSAANIAAAILRLGGTASLISTVSSDAVGHYVLKQLKHYGVETRYVGTVAGEIRTSLAVVETRIENCQSVIYRNQAADFCLTENDVSKIDFSEFSSLIVTGTALALEPSRTSTIEAMESAHGAGLVIVFDIDYRPYSWATTEEASATCHKAARLSDIVIGNDVEFSVLANGRDGEALAREMARSESKVVVYKMGEQGSVTFGGPKRFVTPVYTVKALKPTGAGDAFMGAFVTSLAAGLDLENSVKRGTAAAAIVVTKVGCAPAMPTLQELEAFMASTKQSTS
jgi:5-dehydro-2-deoxygluconokinase